MPGGGRLQIACENRRAETGNSPSDLATGDYVVVTVSDNGSGMSETTLAPVPLNAKNTRASAPRSARNAASARNVIDRHSQLTGQRQSEGAQSASLGDRPGQRSAGQSATHPGLTDRNVEAESIRDVQLSYPAWAVAASSNARTVV